MSRHMIESHLHGKVLNVDQGYATPGAKITLWTKVHPVPDNELFYFDETGDGWFVIASALDRNMVLDVEGGEAKNGAKLILWHRKSPPSPNQLFQWHGDSLRSALGNDLVLDVEGAQQEDGVACILWNHKESGSPNQKWRLSKH